MDLSGKVALVTGAGNGIGRAIALGLSAAGATTIVCDIDGAAGERTAKSILDQGRAAVAMPLDVSDPAGVAAVYGEVAQRYGRLDIQISNAGITTRAPFLDVDLETFHRILSVNLYGTFLCGQAAGRLMRPKGGRIVNLTSVSGQQGGTGRAAYGASKAAIINLTQTMALELAEFGILVNAIAPGPTQVERTAHGPAQTQAFLSRLAIKRYATPADVARAALFLVSDQNDYITGHVLNVDGGFGAAGVMYDPAKSGQ
ncbi:MAG: short-chain dehydrogenase/reductase [Bradyrhizobium sp.]|nr:short-chain dehydrogenase/reductase [Bradyrhizobium sp.]